MQDYGKKTSAHFLSLEIEELIPIEEIERLLFGEEGFILFYKQKFLQYKASSKKDWCYEGSCVFHFFDTVEVTCLVALFIKKEGY